MCVTENYYETLKEFKYFMVHKTDKILYICMLIIEEYNTCKLIINM